MPARSPSTSSHQHPSPARPARGLLKSLSLGLALAAAPTLADTIHLNDGTSVEGTRIVRRADGWDVYQPGGKIQHVAAEAVRSIELKPKGDPADQAAGKLASLRRSVEALSDTKVIIDRFERFVEQHKALPIVEEAKKDLATWKDRQARGLVKVAGKWVTPDERAALQEKALMVADQARELMRQSKFKDAEAAVEAALAGDPHNPSALYLKGLILYRQDKIPPARAAFEEVRKAMPDHGPTLNNLAVIQWRQNQQVAALNTYLAAMQAMPHDKQLLNNVAEALNALPDKDKAGQVPQKVYKAWVEQDAQLQQQMAPLGFYRWGGTWVDKATWDKIQVAEKEIKDKIVKLETEFADAQGKLTTIDTQIASNRDAMVYLERSRYAQNAQGQLVAYPLPPQWYDYDRANRQLEVQRQETLGRIDRLRGQAQTVKANVPVPKFTGVQVAVGPEGTPAVVPGTGPKPRVELPRGGPSAPDNATAAPPVAPALAPAPEPGPKAAAAPEPAISPATPRKPAEKPLKY